MLKIIVELHPFGDSSKKETLSEITIANVGRSSDETSQYLEKHGIVTHKYDCQGWYFDTGDKNKKRKISKFQVKHDRRLSFFLLLYKIFCQIAQSFGNTYACKTDEELVKEMKMMYDENEEEI